MLDCQKTKGREAPPQPECRIAKYLETKEVRFFFFPTVGLDMTDSLGHEILSG